jgi:hypothetical protein
MPIVRTSESNCASTLLLILKCDPIAKSNSPLHFHSREQVEVWASNLRQTLSTIKPAGSFTPRHTSMLCSRPRRRWPRRYAKVLCHSICMHIQMILFFFLINSVHKNVLVRRCLVQIRFFLLCEQMSIMRNGEQLNRSCCVRSFSL